MAYLVDTNVIVAIFKGDVEITEFIEANDCAIDVTIYVECLQGSKSNREKRVIHEYLSRFRLYYHDPAISRRTLNLIDRYSNSHGLRLPDAQIAAVSLVRDLQLLTRDVSDFKFIDGLKLAAVNEAI